ncbi:glycosyltransferase family 4 protein [Candidatus Uhrbacteria bacterium]|nr:MAG: glycosyltransferase family 4 protein [Candidatus Uhrbacteria bacterium]
MKLVYVANSRFPSEKAQSDQVMAMCRSFALLGHEVTLLVPDRKPVQHEDPFIYYGVEPSFSFKRLPCIDGIRWMWLGRIGLWIQTSTFLWSLRKELRRLKPDVVFSRELYVFGVPGIPGKRVWESHALHHSWWATKIAKSLDTIVTLTKASKDRLVESGVDAARIAVESDAVDPKMFERKYDRSEVRRELGIDADTYVCLYTGKFTTMNMSKGLDESIEAIDRLAKKGKKILLLAVGGTPQELERYSVKADTSVRLLGHQPQATLGKFYAAADLLLMPFPYTEHYAYYMSPLKLFEYLMSGVPMVATDLPSVREIVSEASAFIAKPGDIDSLETEIQKAIDRPDEARQKALEAKRISAHYTWIERAKRICAILWP